ncbi:adenosine deaminase family protein [Synoicihabitans lomoniglobus]|uniref:Adenosine deaminase n=1 Tax=Synoicihabitans lomoniglobus TaxID=2909285 RepID=A0AAF0CS17_9BACT|nr:adenosine deaminase [Opitutaceae bacterium LMO-M01]WED67040.1 adenosine deaminase [Opitutaceae bacterium LMO-M01]
MSDLKTDSLRGFIRALPKTETHLHIEGALPYELLHGLDPQKYPMDPVWRRPEYRFESFPKFDETLLGHALPWFNSPERYYEAARVTFAQHVAQNVRYVETSFHLGIVEFVPFSGREIIAAIRAAVPPGLEVRIYAGMLRENYAGPVGPVIDDLVNWDELDGVDLHGFEQVPTEAWTAPVWQRLRDARKGTKCHAGEFDGAARVREAIEDLGVTRVQHGVRAIEDPAVVQLAVDRGVTFDVCPISNVKLRVCESMAVHPLRALRDAGVHCTISSDDPMVFGNVVSDDYAALAIDGDFTRAELADLARAGWAVADVPVVTREAMLAEIDRVAQAHADV